MSLYFGPAYSGTAAKSNPLKEQVDGSHYKNMIIQPAVFAEANNLNYCQSLVIRYICRYKNKGGEKDLDKAIHTIQLLKEISYGNTPKRVVV